jgi:type IV pilus assembly protein PilN
MIRINLIKTETKDVEPKPAGGTGLEAVPPKKKAAKSNLLIFLVIILVGALALLQKRAIDTERARLTAAEDEKRQLQPVLTKLDEVEQQKSFLERKITLINDLKGRQGQVVKFMEGLSSALPEWVWLTEATFNRQTMQVKGRALTNILISDYMRNLEQSGIFESIALLGSNQRTQGATVYLEFTLAANFVQAPSASPKKSPEAK